MARKKVTEDTALDEQALKQGEVVDTESTLNPEDTSTDSTADMESMAGTESKQEATDTEITEEVVEIPGYADALLKAYHNYAELYIDSKEGTYTKDTQPQFVEKAILYKNPYYKS